MQTRPLKGTVICQFVLATVVVGGVVVGAGFGTSATTDASTGTGWKAWVLAKAVESWRKRDREEAT